LHLELRQLTTLLPAPQMTEMKKMTNVAKVAEMKKMKNVAQVAQVAQVEQVPEDWDLAHGDGGERVGREAPVHAATFAEGELWDLDHDKNPMDTCDDGDTRFMVLQGPSNVEEPLPVPEPELWPALLVEYGRWEERLADHEIDALREGRMLRPWGLGDRQGRLLPADGWYDADGQEHFNWMAEQFTDGTEGAKVQVIAACARGRGSTVTTRIDMALLAEKFRLLDMHGPWQRTPFDYADWEERRRAENMLRELETAAGRPLWTNYFRNVLEWSYEKIHWVMTKGGKFRPEDRQMTDLLLRKQVDEWKAAGLV